MANNVLFKKGTGVTASNPAIEAGSLLFDTAAKKIWFDVDASTRIELYDALNSAFKAVDYSDNTIKLYTNADKSDTTPAEVDLPAEQFLETNKTKFVQSFSAVATDFSGTTFTSVTPADQSALVGHAVLGLVMKSSDASDTYTLSLVDLNDLVDSDKASKLTGDDVATHANEITTFTATGDIQSSGKVFVTSVDVAASAADTNVPTEKAVRIELDKKADKVASAVDGDLAGLDANGNLTDSGKSVTTSIAATGASDDKLPSEKAVRTELDKKSDKPASANENNIAIFDDSKNVKDSGKAIGGATLAATPDANTLATEAAVKAVADTKASKLTATGEDTLAAHEGEVVMYNATGDIKSSGMKVATSVRDTANADDATLVTEKAVRSALSSAALEWGTF